jgi:hypothetical protein
VPHFADGPNLELPDVLREQWRLRTFPIQNPSGSPLRFQPTDFTVTVTFTRFAVGFKLDEERASPVEIGVRNAIGSVGIVGSCCTPSC